jgi:hypothetical protein
MKTYKVQWFQHGSPVKINAGTSHDAYRNFLEQEEETKALAVLVKWGAFGIESFSEHLEEGRKKLEEERKAQEEERKRVVLELTERMKSEGFESLNGREIRQISEIVDHSFSNPHAQSNEETNLVKAAVGDSAFYRYLSLRNSSLSAQQQAALLETLGAKLSDISSKAGGIRAGTTFAGLAAAKHLGEEMAEDFGGDE